MPRRTASYSKVGAYFACLAGLLLTVCLIASPAAAQDKGQGKSQSKQMQDAKQRMKESRQKLKEVRQKVMKDNPELQQRRKSIQELQRQKMQEYAGENATRKEKFQAMMKVRRDKEVREKIRGFRDDLIKQMEDVDPKTKQYLQELKSAAKDMQKLKKQQQQQGLGQQKKQ
jgi:membrane-bound lytic murein transglycosylase